MSPSIYEPIPLSSIKADPEIQSRQQLNKGIVKEYKKAMLGNNKFPPIIVFDDGADYWLADGFHRYYAAQDAEIKEMDCEIKKGTRRDAIIFSVGSNDKHGLRRNNADKENAVLKLLGDPEWSVWSDNMIAQKCKVSNHLVSKIREEHLGKIQDKKPERVVARKGTIYIQDTTRIGKTKSILEKSKIDNCEENDSENKNQYSDCRIMPDNTVWKPIVEIYKENQLTEPEKNYKQFIALLDKLNPVLLPENIKSFSMVDKRILKQRLLELIRSIDDALYAID